MIELEVSHEQASVYSKKLWKTAKKSIISSIFEVYRQLYFQKVFEENFIFRQKVKEAFECLIWCLQMVSLLWVPDLPIKNWEENKIIWELIGYLKFDITCSEIGMISECLYFSTTIVFLIFFGMILLVYITYHSYSLPKWLLFIFKKIFYLWVYLLLIPSLSIFTIFLKYNFWPENHISEYKAKNDSSEFEINIFLQISIIFALIVSLLELIFYASFSGEIRHSISSKIINSKAHSVIDLQIYIFTWLLSILWALFAEVYIIYYQFFTMIISAFLMFEFMILLPYFSLFCNTLQILRLAFIALTSFAFIFGYALDNSLIISLLVIILGILAGKLIISFSKKLHSKIKANIPENLARINCEYILEKSLRLALCSNDIKNKDQIIYIFESFYKVNYKLRSKLQMTWIANYCIFTLKDESLAKIKLKNAKNILDWNLEGKYQEYLCRKSISEATTSECENFIHYLHQLNRVKKEDKKLCMNLLRFWEEVTSSKPNLKKIIQGLTSIHSEISFLSKTYNQLTSKFSSSREILSLYSSYAKNILFDLQKSNVLDAKIINFDRIITNYANDSSNFSYFSRTTEVLIISCEKSNFGEILFANQKTSETLQISLNNILGSNISHFVPSIYYEKIKEGTKWISEYGSSSQVDLTEGFFIMTPSHILLECIGKAQLTTINNFLVATLAFKLKPTNHQAALLSEDGEIYCHTLNFPKICNQCTSDLRGFSIKKLFSNLQGLDLKPFTPYRILPSVNETILVLSYFEFNRFKMHFALLINDNAEIAKWKGENLTLNDNQKDEIIRNIRRFSKRLTSIGNEVRSVENQHNENIFGSEMELIQSNEQVLSNNLEASDHKLSVRTDEEKSQKSESSSHNRFLKMIQISLRSINILHAAFIISIFAVIATNISVLWFANYSIINASNMDLPIALGQAAKYFQYLGALSEDIFLIYIENKPSNKEILEYLVADFTSHIEKLDNLYLNINSDLNNWNYCSGQSIFIDENINLWNADNGIYKKKSNLMNTISKFISNAKQFVEKYEKSEDYTEEITFLKYNGVGEASKYCNKSMHDIISCQKDTTDQFENEMLAFLILGIAVFFICVGCMIPFCYSTVKIENNLWNNVRNRVYESYFELRQLSFERLANIYGGPEIELNNRNPSKKPYNFNTYWKYFWRISMYFIVVSVFSIVNIIYLYETSAGYLHKRPEIIRDLMHGQILFMSLAVWTTRTLCDNFAKPSVGQISAFKTSASEWQDVMSEIDYLSTHIRTNGYSSVLSKGFYNKFYENDDSSSKRLALGINPAQNILIFDGCYIVYALPPINVWLSWILDTLTIVEKYNEFANEIDDYSQDMINYEMSIIVVTLVIFIATSFVMYFGLYFTFFRKEKKYLQKISWVFQIIKIS